MRVFELGSKSAQTASGVGFLIVGIFFALFTLFITATSSESGTGSDIFFGWFIAFVVSVAFIEGGVYWIKQSMMIDQSKLDQGDRVGGGTSHWAGRIAVFDRYSSVGKIIVFVLGLIFFVVYFISRSSSFEFNPSQGFYELVLLSMVYVVLRPFLIRGAGNFSRSMKKHLPVYSLESSNIKLDLNMKNIREPGRKYVVNISFSELSEIKELSYAEAQTYLDYHIGPDVTLQAAAAVDMARYLRGEIDKPNYLIFGPSSGHTLLLRGQNIFYLITVRNEDNKQLLSAFDRQANTNALQSPDI